MSNKWIQLGDDWYARSLRQYQGTIHGMTVTVTETGVSDEEGNLSNWKISVHYPGATVEAVERYETVEHILEMASNLAREMSLGYAAARRGEKSQYSPDAPKV